jgi:hypothetical protein
LLPALGASKGLTRFRGRERAKRIVRNCLGIGHSANPARNFIGDV